MGIDRVWKMQLENRELPFAGSENYGDDQVQ